MLSHETDSSTHHACCGSPNDAHIHGSTVSLSGPKVGRAGPTAIPLDNNLFLSVSSGGATTSKSCIPS